MTENPGKDVGKWEALFTIGKSANWLATVKIIGEVSPEA